MTGHARAVPKTPAFRSWVRAVLPIVGTSATALSADLGLGRNGITQFLSATGRDLRLGTAAEIEAEIRRRAIAAGHDLPEIGEASE